MPSKFVTFTDSPITVNLEYITYIKWKFNKDGSLASARIFFTDGEAAKVVGEEAIALHKAVTATPAHD